MNDIALDILSGCFLSVLDDSINRAKNSREFQGILKEVTESELLNYMADKLKEKANQLANSTERV